MHCPACCRIYSSAANLALHTTVCTLCALSHELRYNVLFTRTAVEARAEPSSAFDFCLDRSDFDVMGKQCMYAEEVNRLLRQSPFFSVPPIEEPPSALLRPVISQEVYLTGSNVYHVAISSYRIYMPSSASSYAPAASLQVASPGC
jgi:hypothetical protein